MDTNALKRDSSLNQDLDSKVDQNQQNLELEKLPSIYNKEEQMDFCKRFDDKIY